MNYYLDLFVRVLDFAVPVLVIIFIGIFGSGVLIEKGLMQKLSRFARPIFKYTYLPETCASSFLVALGSSVAANTMIVKRQDDGCLNRREVLLCSLMNSTPAYIRSIFTYQIPIMLPALGAVVGSFYAFVFIITAIIKIIVVVVASRLFLVENPCKVSDTPETEKVSLKTALLRSLKREKKLFLKIAVIYLVMTTLVFALRDQGAFEVFSVLPLAEIFGLPSESIVPLTSYIASPILGASILGPMIHSGSITYLQAMIVLMVGSMFMLPLLGIKNMAPRYVSIFGFRLGLGIVTLSMSISVMIRFILLLILLAIAG
ncbi:nucleoside recognition domain protein [Methanohalobium evestigatum Z-7303]|uniref:Nucleoside recognition domain protein n=1 Tax=Methanohalobium evestigatum (strain ATCC BAA-1072 / DSM 3721 / NBRC 107634 / OCM 161 / Z-7303) TaxID=644295 RepID=D7E6J0_METEZ|nr:nucleoside recognition domain-containing protein [Methanohalobium evestigatum]ADI73212.1 nucleoside recognition domain protein [Methanohalobium evestigatum Z-7303]